MVLLQGRQEKGEERPSPTFRSGEDGQKGEHEEWPVAWFLLKLSMVFQAPP
jgi:hypothetical protein